MLYPQYFIDVLKIHAVVVCRMTTFGLLLILVIEGFGQDMPKAVQVAEFGKTCSEDMEARLDSLLNQMNANPASTVAFVFHGDRSSEGKNIKYLQYIITVYPKLRGIPNTFAKRIKVFRGENLPEMNGQFWLVPPGADFPKPDRPFVPDDYVKPTLYDHSWADFNNWSKKLDIYSDGFYDLGCGFSPNRSLFAKILKQNPRLNGYLIIYTAFGKGSARGHRVANFAVSDLVNNFKVSRKRFTVIYGGNREEPEIEFWLVPKGDQPPKPSPAQKKS